MSKQIIYHGSYCKVREPKIIKGKFSKDFGTGFYCTILENQVLGNWKSLSKIDSESGSKRGKVYKYIDRCLRILDN